ncbi:phenazine biosynthesis-like protein [Oleiphilus messinensis]|uniref:Phenazine biosynthesis-like protein n=1 Tax=Oleiphilus messinensis TaxID=141451 RepID=A0A1Y0IHG1_9GAMM|nr:PhzF family phenazine biosynthesis isomerase [Oleiphilus messinensis]ARU58843.1 phenazine biosynthesis-like protein [Oleiphilus messinensis]
MPVTFSLLDVFADVPFQGTQIPVVETDDALSEDMRTAIAGEFRQTETVFVNRKDIEHPFSVYNHRGPVAFGAHTILAASFVAEKTGLTHDEGSFSVLRLQDEMQQIESFIDKTVQGADSIQYKCLLRPTLDAYTPELSRIAQALQVEEKHFTYSRYKPLLVSVDHPILIVPLTKPEHILAANLVKAQWASLLSDIYASEILLFSPGSISGMTDFHGRLINPYLAQDDYPPIGSAVPEFIAYLAQLPETAEGTHTFSIDRGSLNTRKSVIHAEFDKRKGKETQCRIGGRVIKVGEGRLLVPLT